jgi:FkbM family methyltransferase
MESTVNPGPLLVFDVGANVGAKTAEFLAKGARVVCFEPVPECVEALRTRFEGQPAVTIVPTALGATPGTLPLSICSEATTISTFSEAWKTGRFKDFIFNRTLQVPLSTLDAAIAAYGCPDYVKIDVEGYELPVLQGISQQVPILSFEFCAEGLARASACLERLLELGYRRFNLVYGAGSVMRHCHWIDAAELIHELREHPSPLAWGDIYACGDGTPGRALAALLPSAPVSDELPNPQADSLTQVLWRGLAYPGVPLRLHLGAGEQRLPDYINVDFPSELHNVMNVRPDLAADITTLEFPRRSVDEVRLHHVFEHFNRVVALGLLIRWQRWLKPGGRLLIETPDFEGEARAFLKDLPEPIDAAPGCEPPSSAGRISFSNRMSAMRSLEGDQTAAWGYHVGHWFAERFEHTLTELGFTDIRIQRGVTGHLPALHNITAAAVSSPGLTEEEQLSAAYRLLWDSTVAADERPTWETWCRQLEQFLRANRAPAAPFVPDGRQPVIAIRLVGGLGNQLFQYAAARAASLRLDADLLLDVSDLQSDPLRSFILPAFKIAGRTVSNQDVAGLRQYSERFYHYDEAFEDIQAGTLLSGYFQSELYFANYFEHILADLQLSDPPSAKFDAYAAAIRASALPVSVHLRRSDFVANPQTLEFHGICGAEYYKRAADVIARLIGVPPDWFVFSDDRAAALEISSICPGATIVQTDANLPWEDMVLMSLCRHHVLANSSFSWWGDWLDRRPGKMVVAPRHWVAPKTLRQLNTADLYPLGTIIL